MTAQGRVRAQAVKLWFNATLCKHMFDATAVHAVESDTVDRHVTQ